MSSLHWSGPMEETELDSGQQLLRLTASRRNEGARVAATVLDQSRGDKIIVFRKKRRKNYRRKQGHRQAYTEIRVDKIEGL